MFGFGKVSPRAIDQIFINLGAEETLSLEQLSTWWFMGSSIPSFVE